MNPATMNIEEDGLRAVSRTAEIESGGNLGGNAQRALEFYRQKRRKQTVEVRVQRCRVRGCTWWRQ